MHYFIDGYNLLFRLLHGSNTLQSQREAIIYDLNQKISLIKLDVSIVFDAAFQIGGRSRSHYDQLEILFTAEGETADEYILDEIKNMRHPRQETVVTSDKTLAWHVRTYSAHTESVEEFMQWVNRAYKNKIHPLKKIKQPPSTAPPPLATPSPPRRLIPDKDAPLEAYTDYYAQVFEAEWQEILTEEQKRQQTPSSPRKRPPRKSKRPQDPFQSPQPPETREATEMERWLKAFEKRSLEQQD